VCELRHTVNVAIARLCHPVIPNKNQFISSNQNPRQPQPATVVATARQVDVLWSSWSWVVNANKLEPKSNKTQIVFQDDDHHTRKGHDHFRFGSKGEVSAAP
jgi:hypothetical protein